MNKFFLFLAFASFALLACSDDPALSHEEHCAKKPVNRECLVGKWYLENVIRENGLKDADCNLQGDNYQGELIFEANRRFSFKGGVWDLDIRGNWNIEAGELVIECTVDCAEEFDKVKVNANVDAKGLGFRELRIASLVGSTVISQCKPRNNPKPTEVFSWQGTN